MNLILYDDMSVLSENGHEKFCPFFAGNIEDPRAACGTHCPLFEIVETIEPNSEHKQAILYCGRDSNGLPVTHDCDVVDKRTTQYEKEVKGLDNISF